MNYISEVVFNTNFLQKQTNKQINKFLPIILGIQVP